jgi:hypothetical protein
MRLMNQYNDSPTTMDELHLKVLSWLKGESFQRHVQFGVKCGLVQYENKVATTEGIHSLNLEGENNLESVQKSSQRTIC